MPSGYTHDRITLWSLPFITGFSLVITRNATLTLLLAGAFLFSGLMFGPDLDIYSVQFKRWGVFGWIWLPYRKMLRHRSVFSHGLIIGTIVRLIYLLSLLTFVAIFIVAIAQLIWGFSWNWQSFFYNLISQLSVNHPQETISFLLGLELGAMSHSCSDLIGSAYKRYHKRGIKASKNEKNRENKRINPRISQRPPQKRKN